MKEEAIIKSLFIKRIGESQYFQIVVPRDVRRVVGIEYGATEKNGELLPSPFLAIDENTLIVSPNKIIGRLTLRTAGCEGIFFQENLIEESNVHFGENVASVLWQPQRWTHGRKRYEAELCISENSMIYGVFQDSWGAGEFETLNYRLNLFLWVEKCIA